MQNDHHSCLQSLQHAEVSRTLASWFTKKHRVVDSNSEWYLRRCTLKQSICVASARDRKLDMHVKLVELFCCDGAREIHTRSYLRTNEADTTEHVGVDKLRDASALFATRCPLTRHVRAHQPLGEAPLLHAVPPQAARRHEWVVAGQPQAQQAARRPPSSSWSPCP